MKQRCAICKHKQGDERMFDFRALIKNLGYVGNRAHPKCIIQARIKINKKRKRMSLPPITSFSSD